MATNVELATGYVTLAVDASQVGAQVSRAFTGVGRQGTQAGRQLGRSMAQAFERESPDMDALAADVERAEQRATTAIERNATKQEAAKRKVDIAQAKLAEAVRKYGEDSSQALTAQDRLATAQQRHEGAAIGATREQERLNRELRDAREAFSQAERAAESAARGSEGSADRYARGWRGVGQRIRGFVVGGVQDATDAADREAGDSDGADSYVRGWRGVGSRLRGDLVQGVRSATDDAEDEAARGGREAGGGFKDAFKGAVAGMAAYAGIQEIGQTMWSGIQGAGELEQSVGAISTVFGDSSGKMLQWSNDAAAAVGLSKNEFNELGTLMGSQLKNGGTAIDELAPKTNELITLGSDLSSMFGGSTTEAVEALSSALKGERDPIEKYGVSLNQAKIDAKAAELGFKKVGGSISSEASQAATLALIMDQTADAHGNFARESDTFAHKQQVMAAQWEDLKAKMGEMFLPVLTKVFGFIGDKALPALAEFTGGIRAFGMAWKDNTGDVTSGGFAGSMEKLANNLRDAYDWLAKYAPIWGPFAAGIGLVAGAYAVWAGASWALTAAQGALATAIAAVNWPIVAVVAAVGLLIGGLIMAYKRIGWFKDFVDGAFTVLKTVAVAAWSGIRRVVAGFATWLIATAWPTIMRVAQWIGAKFVWLWQDVIVPAWGFIRAVIAGFLNWFTSSALPWIRGAVAKLGQGFVWLLNNVIKPVWVGIRFAVAIAVGIVMTIFQGLIAFVRRVLAPAFMWLYNNVIKPVFGWIVNAAKAWWAGLKSNFEAVRRFISNVLAPVVRWLWRNVFGPVFRNIATSVQNAWQRVIQPTFRALKTGMGWVGDKAAALRSRWATLWGLIRSAASAAWAFIRDRALNPLKAGLSRLGDKFSAVKSRITTLWQGLRTALFNGFTAIRDKTFGPLKTAVNSVKRAFEKAQSGIKTAWDKLKNTTKGPVKFFVNTVYNDGLRANINKVLDKVGLKDKHLPTLSLPSGFARGGVLPGYQSRKKDDQLRPMRSGEGVLVPEVVRGIGAQSVHELNAAGNAGGPMAVRRVWDDMRGQSQTPSGAIAAGPGTSIFGGMSSIAGPGTQEVYKYGELSIKDLGVHSSWQLSRAASWWDKLNIVNVNTKGQGMTTARSGVGGVPYHAQYTWNPPQIQFGSHSGGDVDTAAHEIGHALGLPHDGGGHIRSGAQSIMDYRYLQSVGGPTTADVQALRKIYPNWLSADSATRGVKGGGGGILDILGDTWTKLIAKLDGAKNQITSKFPSNVVGDMGGGVAKMLASGVKTKITSWIQDKIDAGGDTINNLLGRGDMNGREKGAVGESTVSGWMTTALKKKGLFSDANLRAGLSRARQESGFDPGEINRWDSNWLRGDPSKGLMQVIGSTFNRHKEPGHGDIWNGLDNILASINYTIATYGSLGAGWNRAGGYALGGIVDTTLYDGGGLLHEGLTLMEHRQRTPDKILTDQQWRVMSTIATGKAEGGQDLGRAIELLEQIANADRDVTVKVGEKAIFEAHESWKRKARIG